MLPSVEVMYLRTRHEYSYLSSSVVREVMQFGGELEGLVPDSVLKFMVNKKGESDVRR